jgi:hypothetical protein
VQIVDHLFHQLNRRPSPLKTSPMDAWPVRGVHVLDDVAAALLEQWEQHRKTRSLVVSFVRAVVQDDINASHLVNDTLQKSRIVL